MDTDVADEMIHCHSDGPLVVHTTKQYPNDDATAFNILGRVLSGTLHAHAAVRVLGEKYSLQDEEDSRVLNVGRLWIYQARCDSRG